MAQLDRDMEVHICEAWNKLKEIAREAKKAFNDCHAEALRFYAQPNHNFMFEKIPGFAVTLNKVYELVSIFGPHLYAQNPVRRVSSRKFAQNPAIAVILDELLNYTPGEFAFKTNSEQAITDGLISGRGALFTTIDKRTGLPISTQEDAANILVDPSEEKWYDGYYIMRVCRDVPLWKIAREYGEDKIKRLEGVSAHTANDELGFTTDLRRADFGAKSNEHESERTYDAPRATYIKVWSKMGIGLRGVTSNERKQPYKYGRDSSDYV
jgi:hypothetical protein